MPRVVTEALIAAAQNGHPEVRTKAVEGLGNAISSGNEQARNFLEQPQRRVIRIWRYWPDNIWIDLQPRSEYRNRRHPVPYNFI